MLTVPLLIFIASMFGLGDKVSQLFQPTIRHTKKSKGDAMDEMYGITYHKVKPTYDIEGIKVLMANLKQNQEVDMRHSQYEMDNYKVQFNDYIIWFHKDSVNDGYVFQKTKLEGQTIHIYLIGVAGTHTDYDAMVEKTVNKYKKDKKITTALKILDMYEDAEGNKQHTGISLLYTCLQDFASVKASYQHNRTEKRSYMTAEDIQKTTEQLDLMQKYDLDPKHFI